MVTHSQILKLIQVYEPLWHSHRQLWLEAVKAGQPLILIGYPKQGTLAWGLALIQSLYCQSHPDQPCQTCPSCQAIVQRRWPWVQGWDLSEDSLNVDAIRTQTWQLMQHGAGAPKPLVFWVFHAHRMLPNTANAWLKTLEEAPAQTGFLLITHQPHRLLPTIRSRGFRLMLPLLSRDRLEKLYPQASVTQLKQAYGQLLALENPENSEPSDESFWENSGHWQTLAAWALRYQKKMAHWGYEIANHPEHPLRSVWLRRYQAWSLWLQRLGSPANPDWQRQGLLAEGLELLGWDAKTAKT